MEAERRRIELAGRARWVDYRPEARKRMPKPLFVVSLPGDPAFGNQLTFKQRQVLALYALGLGRRQIRSNLGLLHRTLRSREEAMMQNLGVNSIRDALATGRRRGIVA
jgi:DNA-binding NarL/FixJ family response regulator